MTRKGKHFFMPEFPCRFSSPKANFVQELMKENTSLNLYTPGLKFNKLPSPFTDFINNGRQLLLKKKQRHLTVA